MPKVIINTSLITEALTRSVDKIYPSFDALKRELMEGRPLSVYLGIDPTSPHLHLGHAVSLWTLRRLQNLGHKIILLVGDFTAQIGDPTDKLAPRQPITEDEVKKNMRTFIKQASRIISFLGKNPAQIRYNSEWYKKIKLEKFINDSLGYFSFQNLYDREDFKRRVEEEHRPLQLQEFIYPLLQGYDGVALGNVDVEVGGRDQIFNMNIGRALREAHSERKGIKKEKFFIATQLLVNPDTGKKLSKTEVSLVNLDDKPNEMFGRVMAMPDGMIFQVAEFSTAMPIDAIKKFRDIKNLRDAKLALAFEIVKTYHGEKAAKKAQERWEELFSKKEIAGAKLPELEIKSKKISALDLVSSAKIVKSRSEARRLIQQGGLKINGQTKNNPAEILGLRGGEAIKIGKKNFYRIEV